MWHLKVFEKIQIILLLLCLMNNLHAYAGGQFSQLVEAWNTTEVGMYELNENTCMQTRADCCDSPELANKNVLLKCLILHQAKMAELNFNDVSKTVKFMSCFVECLLRRLKYIGQGDNLNMQMVRRDAEHLYKDKPKEQAYYVAMYEYCGKKAYSEYVLIKNNPAARFILRDACKPYFMFVYACLLDYQKKISCPYFRWEGKSETAMAATCKAAKTQCYEIENKPT